MRIVLRWCVASFSGWLLAFCRGFGVWNIQGGGGMDQEVAMLGVIAPLLLGAFVGTGLLLVAPVPEIQHSSWAGRCSARSSLPFFRRFPF